MKKLVILVVLTVLLSACSKNGDNGRNGVEEMAAVVVGGSEMVDVTSVETDLTSAEVETIAEEQGRYVTIGRREFPKDSTELDLSVNDLSQLNLVCTSFPNLEKLKIQLEGMTNISGLSKLQEITYLELEFSRPKDRVIDLKPLSELSNLEFLSISLSISSYRADEFGLTSLAGLTNLKKLELLNLSGISDFSPLTELVNLEKLSISIFDMTDFSPLVTLENLSEFSLRVYSKQEIDISAFEELTALTSLYLNADRGFTNITPLDNLINLESFTVYAPHYYDVPEGIGFWSGYAYDITQLEKMPRLTGLAIYDKFLPPKGDLKNFDNITSLRLTVEHDDCSFDERADYDVLTELANLTELVIEGHHLCNTEFISAFSALETLEIETRYSISDLTPISKLSNLKSLSLWERHSNTDLKQLQGLKNITELSAFTHYGSIININSLTEMVDLRELSIVSLDDYNSAKIIAEEAIADITALKELSNLKRLGLVYEFGGEWLSADDLSELIAALPNCVVEITDSW
ncbi:MAG: hypothetical protein FWG90_09325 [Oscillospiraceae bacterium]|nr:hypothetical protein [Oscillospiraceae bacterium]